MRITLIATLLILACAIVPHQACHTYSIPDTDELTEGPYWIDPELNRSNITGGQIGSAYTLTLRLFNKTQLAAACAATAGNESNQPLIDGTGAMQGAQVDIWYASAAGQYSGFASEGTAGQTWLRGYQKTDSQGYVTFQSIFPGWYTGRTTHIHIRVRIFDASGTQTYDDTTQLFFDDKFSDSVYAANSLYNHGTRTTYNSGDGIYQAVMQMNTTGSLATGYSSTFNLYYPFTTTGGGGGGGNNPTPPNGGGGNPPTRATTTTAPVTQSTSAPTNSATIAPASATTTTIPTNAPTTITDPASSSFASTTYTNTAFPDLPSFCLMMMLGVGMLLLQ